MYYINSKISYNKKIKPITYHNYKKSPLFSKEERGTFHAGFLFPLFSPPPRN